MKEATYPLTSWQGLINYIKKGVGRQLTDKEYKKLMSEYITGVSAEDCLKQLQAKKGR
jgi:hypothetical protein